MNASDFTDNSLTGIATVMNGRAIITKTLSNDFTSEGTESFTFNIKTSAGGPIIATSAPIIVADTSVPIASVSPSTNSVNEGSAVTFNVTSNVLSGTLFWDLNPVSGTINASDFVGAATTGSFTTNGSGVGSTTLTLANDFTTEPTTESFQLQVRTGSTFGTISTTSSTITVTDTSLTPVTATITPDSTSLIESSVVTYNVTSNQPSSTLSWTIKPISGTINASDFIQGTSGSFITNGSGFGSFVIAMATDFTTEGTESFQVEVRTGGIGGNIATTSSTLTVTDTSPAPTATVTPSTTSVTEGSSVTFNVTSNQLSSVLTWEIPNSATIDSSDFSSLSGSVNTDGTGAGSFIITPLNDGITEGPQSFQLVIRAGGINGNIIATSAAVTINDPATALYAFTTATFNTGGINGPTGPTLSQAASTLTGPEVATWSTNTSFFNMVTTGIQLWTVPATASYRITAAGASSASGGLGANIQGTFSLTQGQIIQILVGQQGTLNGGGGGSYVVKNNATTIADIFLIAGGGGGKTGGSGGTATTSNSTGTVSNGNGGNSSNSAFNGPAGGGFLTSGTVSSGSPTGNVGGGFLQGGFGGDGTSKWGGGGFGGGGSGGSDNAAGGGGGGGYSGGDGTADSTSGKGAGSFPNGTNQSNTANSQSGNGFVTITKL
jgi:hypothetical protein